MDHIERFADDLEPDQSHAPAHVREFVVWHRGSEAGFQPSDDDDVALRTYLLHLRTTGARPADQRQRMASLRQFYAWAVAQDLIPKTPFQDFSVERSRLSREQIRRRKETVAGSSEELQIARLRALNELATQLNRSPDVRTTLNVALDTLVGMMRLQTAWAFLLPEAESHRPSPAAGRLHDFDLAAACGLPPGLERDGRNYLCAPPDCHCQMLFRANELKRAVNVVECTRLRDSAETDGDNRGLLFHASVPIASADQRLGIINVATEEWQFLTSADLQLLSAVGAQLGTALERARLFDVAESQRQRLMSELQVAAEVQASLLPPEMPDIPGFSLAAEWRSALEMAGDFYDVFPLSGGRWGLVIADVSDKGAPAALYMAMVRSLIRATAESASSPAATLREVNRIIQAHSSSDSFVTVFYAVLRPKERALTYANAGHHPPLVRRAEGSVERLMPTGPALGIFDEMEVSETTIRLEKREGLVAYTDGVTDAQSPQGEEYGFTRLSAAVANAPMAGAGPQLDHLLDDLAAFAEDVPPADDVTFFLVVCDGEA